MSLKTLPPSHISRRRSSRNRKHFRVKQKEPTFFPPSFSSTRHDSYTMSSTTPTILDFTSAVEYLKTDYQRDGLDVKSLLDSDKRGGMT